MLAAVPLGEAELDALLSFDPHAAIVNTMLEARTLAEIFLIMDVPPEK
ncbi:hypothetical protein [Cohnella sp. 56]